MTTIRIVTNSDRCHVSIDGQPSATFMYSNYQHNSVEVNKSHAMHDAKAECFNALAKLRENGVRSIIDTVIVQG